MQFCKDNDIDPTKSPDVVEPWRTKIQHMLEEYALLLPPSFRAVPPNGHPSVAGDIWGECTFHICWMSLFTPRRGAGLDPTILLSNASWLASSDFAFAAEHSARVAELIELLDTADPLRERVDNTSEVPFAQICGTMAFVRMIVSQQAFARLVQQTSGAQTTDAQGIRNRILASSELAKQNFNTIRRQQTLVGRRSRMAAQMALYLRTALESSNQFGSILDKITKSESIDEENEVPVIWTEQGLILNHGRRQVVVGWDDMMGVPERDEWNSTRPGQEGEGGFTPATASSHSSGDGQTRKPGWRWRLAGGPDLEKRIHSSASPLSSAASSLQNSVSSPLLMPESAASGNVVTSQAGEKGEG